MSDAPEAPEIEYLSDKDDGDLAAHIQSEVKADLAASGEWRQEARKAYEFTAGRQWDDDDAETLRNQGRPPITFDRTSPMIDAICGAQVNNRQEMKFYPRGMEDSATAEAWNVAVQWVRDQCDAEDEESEAFRDTVICGMGWIETRMDYEDSYAEGGKIVQERVDPFEMGWDRSARKRNLEDAGHYWRRQMMDPDEVAARWPEFAGVGAVARGDVPDAPNRVSVRPTKDAYADGEDTTAGTDVNVMTVVHFQWCERRPVHTVLDPVTQQPMKLDDEQWLALKDRVGEDGVEMLKHVQTTKKVWWEAFECGGQIAGRQECPNPEGSTFKCITGRRDRNKRMFYGVVRSVMDPQMWANKWLSQALHIINTNAKSGVVYEEGAIEDVRKFEQSYAKTGSATQVAAGGLSRMREKVPPPFPQGFDRLLQFAISSIPDVTGINREMLGTVDRQQAGVLEAQRKQASQAVLAPIFDSLRRYYKEQGRLLMIFVEKYLPPDTMMRIAKPGADPQVIMRAMLPESRKFDITIDQAPTSPNQKTEVWNTLQPAIPMLLKTVPGPIIVKLLEFSPLPESVVADIKEMMQNAPPPPPDPMVEKTKADMALKQQDAQMKAQEMTMSAQMEREKMAAQIEMDQRKAAQDMMLAKAQAELDLYMTRAKAELDMAMTAAKAEQSREVERYKVQAQVEANRDKADADRQSAATAIMGSGGQMASVVSEALSGVLRDLHDKQEAKMQTLSDLLAESQRLMKAPRKIVRDGNNRVAGMVIEA